MLHIWPGSMLHIWPDFVLGSFSLFWSIVINVIIPGIDRGKYSVVLDPSILFDRIG